MKIIVTNEDIEATKAAIAHWENMVDWVKLQPGDMKANEDLMENKIGEDWFSKHCPLCKLYSANCYKCPVVVYGESSCDDMNSIWARVQSQDTWADWLKSAAEMITMLKDLIPLLQKDLEASKGVSA